MKREAPGSSGFYLPRKFKSLVDTEETVTLITDTSKMGTGVATSLTMLLAGELDGDWKKIRR